MSNDRSANMLGAFSLALADAQAAATRAATGLSPSACAVLATLGPHPDSSIGGLAPVLGLTHSVTVRLIDALVTAGLVARRTGADRRQVLLRLTAQGAKLRKAMLRARHTTLGRLVEALAEEERADFTRMLEQLLARLTPDRDTADHICRLCDEGVCPPDRCPVEQEAVRIEGKEP